VKQPVTIAAHFAKFVKEKSNNCLVLVRLLVCFGGGCWIILRRMKTESTVHELQSQVQSLTSQMSELRTAASSYGRRNTCAKFTRGSFESQCLSGSFIPADHLPIDQELLGLIGPPKVGTVNVQFLLDAAESKNARVVCDVKKQIQFYLIEKGESVMHPTNLDSQGLVF
jgi:hypothetical protein